MGGWKISNGDKLHSRHAPLLRGEHPRAPRQMPLSSHLPHGFCIPSKPELSAANLSSFFPPEFSKQRDDDFPPSLYIYACLSHGRLFGIKGASGFPIASVGSRVGRIGREAWTTRDRVEFYFSWGGATDRGYFIEVCLHGKYARRRRRRSICKTRLIGGLGCIVKIFARPRSGLENRRFDVIDASQQRRGNFF